MASTDENVCCCHHCLRQWSCTGCNWRSDVCKEDKSQCEILAQHKRLCEIFGVGDIDDKGKS